MVSFVYFIPLAHLNTHKHTESDSIMEQHGNTGNTGTNNKIDLTNLREVHVYHEDGSIKETFWFPITPPPPIVIEDSSDTETEEEEEEKEVKDDKKEETKEQEQEKEDNKKEAEKAEAEAEEEEETEETEEHEEEEEKEEEEEEEEEESNKRRRIGGPAPLRADRSANNRSHDLTPLQPAPSITQQEPALEPALDTTAPPQSPLPELDVNMDIIAVMEEHGM